MAGMGREPNNLRLHSPLETEPTFTLTFRGYNRREVDQYAQITETQLQAAVAERDELAARIQTLTEQLHQAHAELVDLRRRPKLDEKISFRHLGPRVEQILAEAEREAEELRAAATESLAEERAAVAAERARIADDFNRMVREYEASQQARRAEEEVAIAQRLEAVRIEVAEGQAYARKVRSEAEDLMSQTQAEVRRLLEEADAQAGRVKAEARDFAQAVRLRAEQDATAIAHSAEEYARETREEAEAHAHQTRVAAEEHARQTIAAAEQGATLVRQQAEQYAAQVRAAAQKHVARLKAAAPGGGAVDGRGPDEVTGPLSGAGLDESTVDVQAVIDSAGDPTAPVSPTVGTSLEVPTSPAPAGSEPSAAVPGANRG
jgi:cell division septum initiation protein DivIVA